MKKILLGLAIAIGVVVSCNRPPKDKEVLFLQDKMALKELVDTFSTLADDKKVDEQMELFTEDVVITSISNGQTNTYKGKKEIGDAFKEFLAPFETVYHINGQQTVSINGDKASGISYCTVVLIIEENGHKMMITRGVRYNDEYVKKDGRWYIKNRTSHFTYNDTREVK